MDFLQKTFLAPAEKMPLPLEQLLFYCIFAFLLGSIIRFTYKITHKRKDVTPLIAVLPPLITILFFVTENELPIFILISAILIAISISSKEIISILFSAVAGILCGTDNLLLSAGFVIIFSLVFLIFYYFSNGANCRSCKLIIFIPERMNFYEIFNDTFEKYCKTYDLEEIKSTEMGSIIELNYYIIIKSNIDTKQFIDDLRMKNGNLSISLTKAIERA